MERPSVPQRLCDLRGTLNSNRFEGSIGAGKVESVTISLGAHDDIHQS